MLRFFRCNDPEAIRCSALEPEPCFSVSCLPVGSAPPLWPREAQILARSLHACCNSIARGITPPHLSEAQKLETAVKARDGANSASYANALNLVGNVHSIQGEYAEAETLHQRALTILEKVLGPSALDVARTSTTSLLYTAAKANTPRPSRSSRRALAIREKALGPSHPDVG